MYVLLVFSLLANGQSADIRVYPWIASQGSIVHIQSGNRLDSRLIVRFYDLAGQNRAEVTSLPWKHLCMDCPSVFLSRAIFRIPKNLSPGFYGLKVVSSSERETAGVGFLIVVERCRGSSMMGLRPVSAPYVSSLTDRPRSAVSAESRHCRLFIVARFALRWRHVANRFEQPTRVEPIARRYGQEERTEDRLTHGAGGGAE